MRIVDLEEIRAALDGADLLPAIEAGFVAYSAGRAVVPPIGELLLEDPPGEVHIKYGYLEGGSHYVVKIASGFSDNPSRGLPTADGMMLLFRQDTGEPDGLLLDRGYLTDVRTAVAGALVARELAPPRVRRVGIVGTGTQARLQLRHLRGIVDCEEVAVWGRTEASVERYRREMRAEGWTVHAAADVAEIGRTCQLIVTTTPSHRPLLRAGEIAPGTHITAVGSDTVGKQELEAEILGAADRVVADSLPQCRARGEVAAALAAGVLDEKDVVELGAVLAGDAPGRTDAGQTTVADLTGVAVQDLQAARAVLDALEPIG